MRGVLALSGSDCARLDCVADFPPSGIVVAAAFTRVIVIISWNGENCRAFVKTAGAGRSLFCTNSERHLAGHTGLKAN